MDQCLVITKLENAEVTAGGCKDQIKEAQPERRRAWTAESYDKHVPPCGVPFNDKDVLNLGGGGG